MTQPPPTQRSYVTKKRRRGGGTKTATTTAIGQRRRSLCVVSTNENVRRRGLARGGARVASCFGAWKELPLKLRRSVSWRLEAGSRGSRRRMLREGTMPGREREQRGGEKAGEKGPRRKLRMKNRILIHHHT